MEQQLKKAEAAQKRKVQIEKAARESEVSVTSLYHRYEHLKYWQIHERDGLGFVFYRQRPLEKF